MSINDTILGTPLEQSTIPTITPEDNDDTVVIDENDPYDVFNALRRREVVKDITDANWLKDSFIVKAKSLDDKYKNARYSTGAAETFIDTSLGGSIAINAAPQYTRYADIRANSGASLGEYSHSGIGRYYFEAIELNATNVYMSFGVPAHNNILHYLMSSVDYKKSVLANSGRSSFAYDAGKIFGVGALIIAFPLITPALLLGKYALSFASDMLASPGKFDHYYMKDTMHLYWSTVNSIANMMFTELGMLNTLFYDSDKKNTGKIGSPLKTMDPNSDATMGALREMMPGLITENNAVNIHAIISRSQRMANARAKANMKKMKELADGEPYSEVSDEPGYANIEVPEQGQGNLWDNIANKVKQDPNYAATKGDGDLMKRIEELVKKLGKEIGDLFSSDEHGQYTRKLRKEDDASWITKFADTSTAVWDEGARYAIFRVEHVGSSSISFSNSATNVDISDKINSMGSKFRDIKFNMGVGNIPFVSDALHAVTDFAAGALSGVTLGLSDVVFSFLSGSQVAVYKRWQDSSVSLPTHTYKMTLTSPSAHPVAQLRNLYIPLASIIAGAIPLSTGPRSYTSPYMCSLFSRGVDNIKMGMITSLSITKGTSNLSFNKSRRPLAIEVSFSVTDFSELISAPMPSNMLDTSSVAYDDEAGLNRYIASLCARDLYSTNYVFDKAKIKISRWLNEIDVMTSPEYWGSKVGSVGENYLPFMSHKKSVVYSESQ